MVDAPNPKTIKTYQRKIKGNKNCKDLISSLTDDILLDIISLLDLKEAARTCVLSKKWRNVWSNLSDLDFDAAEKLYTLKDSLSVEQYAARIESEVHFVNHVVDSSLAPNINRFRVHILLNAMYRYDVHRWVNFAMEKSVKELELDLSDYMGGSPLNRVSLNHFSRYAKSPSLHSLVSLSLVAINICESFLEFVLWNFSNLERLTMKKLHCGGNMLKVVGDSLKLKYLEIFYCSDLKEVQISAGSLISVVYFGGSKQDVKFGNVPLFNEASFGGPNSIRSINNLHHSGFLSQLTKLSLTTTKIQNIISSTIWIPQLRNVKQLEFLFCDSGNQSLVCLAVLIDACPVLRRFKLKHLFHQSSSWLRGNMPEVTGKAYPSLNVFEMVGFRGAPLDVEFVLYLAQSAIVLEKIILDPHRPFAEGKPSVGNTLEQIGATRKRAKELVNQLPARVKLEVR